MAIDRATEGDSGLRSSPGDARRDDESAEFEFRGKLIRLGILNNVSGVVTILTGLVMVPIMLAGLDRESYGVWIMIISLKALVLPFDLGLGLVVTREVARSRGTGQSEASAMAQAAGGSLILVGLLGGLVLAGIGLAAERIHLPGLSSVDAGRVVFPLVGMALLAEQTIQYTIAVFSAHMRFGLGNLILSASTLLRAALVTLALAFGTGLIGVASAYASGAALTATSAMLLLRHVDARYAITALRLDWSALRPQVQFGLSSFLATIAGALLWQIHPLMIGTLVAPAAVVSFFVGMRLPMLVSDMSWRTAEVAFPAVAGTSSGSKDPLHASIALSTGMRWLTLLVVPLAVMGCILAPSILDTWLIDVPEGAVTILRVGVAVMLLDAWAVAALQVLWGLGKAGRIAIGMCAAAITAVALDFALLPGLGAVAAPIAMIAGLTILAGLVFSETKRCTGVSLFRLFRRDIASLLPAGVACAAATALGDWIASGAGNLASLTVGALFGIGGYAVALRYSRAAADEMLILRRTFDRLKRLPNSALRALRARAKRVKVLRSAWYLVRVLYQRLPRRSAATADSFDKLFDTSPDPWRYDSPEEVDRHLIAEELIDGIPDARATERVLEIACAEGAFTERLAGRCRSLLSLDISRVAIERARHRRVWGDCVRFAQLDLVRDEIPGSFTLVVVMDVLTYIQSVAGLHKVRDKLVAATEPGGWILVGDVRQSEVFETSWWGKRLLCGGRRICEFMAEHAQLSLEAQAETETHVFRLLRKSR